MALANTDLKIYKAAAISGGAISATELTSSNLFDAFSGAETSAGGTFYACVYVKNTNSTANTAFATKVYVNSESSHTGAFGTVNARIALGNAAINGIESDTGSELTAPTPALTFVDASGSANALTIGDLAVNAYKSVWIELTIPAGTTAFNNYTIQLGIDADTGA